MIGMNASHTAELPDDLAAFDVRREGHTAEVTLIGPSKGNAMGPDFWRELPLVFRALDADPEVRAIVLAGSGKHFSYGLDLNAMLPEWAEFLAGDAQAGPRTRFLDQVRRMQEAITSVAACRTPVIAAVSGWCIGGGVDLIAGVDIRLASEDAQFSVREVKLAIVADMGSLQRLGGIVGEGHLRELALTGKDIGAARAERIGLVNDVYADRDALLAAARELAAELAANPPLVVQGIKDVLSMGTEQQVDAGLRYVSAWNAAFLPSKDLGEAVQAFLEKRPPRFTGE